MPNSGKDETGINRHGAMGVIFIAWFLAGAFGDEIVGGMLYGLDESMGFVMARPWWWVYQGAVCLLFGSAALAVHIWSRQRDRDDRK